MINTSELSSGLSSSIGICFELSLNLSEVRDIGRSARVCKLWNEAFENQEIWIGLSEREGIPLVDGLDRDRRADFQVLYPMTISGKRIGRLFGDLVGPIPRISELVFSKLNDPDRFEKETSMKKTFVFVVDPHLIKRTAGVGTPLDLDAQGNLIELPADQVQNGKELIIPFSSKNLRVLCSHPLNGKKNMLVFTRNSDDKIFNQYGASSNKVRVYFMREFVANETRNKSYFDQENCLDGTGLGITAFCIRARFNAVKIDGTGLGTTPFRIRALFNAVKILETGKCPDSLKPRCTYARCSDIVPFDNNVRHVRRLIIGGFAPDAGVGVLCHDFYYGVDSIGVVPGCPAEVPRPLALGEGH